jgi:hypothetical protein
LVQSFAPLASNKVRVCVAALARFRRVNIRARKNFNEINAQAIGVCLQLSAGADRFLEAAGNAL